ncbi:hypothetical protein KC19_12G047900 [Ceratodon purpureus]|uniref:Uncharacterized protein n=1 Tax=Ceratodon purpureus TaxID=3225 RepID=A0A8T0G786_CERPU|nr:hypothetical protein KC19_12G047900 [Ceratodon purpureus]
MSTKEFLTREADTPEYRMVGYDSQKSFGKPSRSEDLGTPEEQEEHARKVRAYLEANAPKRIVKPSRSDADDMTSNATSEVGAISHDPPERMKYLQLLANGAPLQTLGSGEVDEDYTESEYYKCMAAIDKEHHTTGTGFIKIDKTPGGFHLHVANPQGSRSFRERYRCNPAMNDWEPAHDISVAASTLKPLRSESGVEL